jgi:hypothetical protein
VSSEPLVPRLVERLLVDKILESSGTIILLPNQFRERWLLGVILKITFKSLLNTDECRYLAHKEVAGGKKLFFKKI